ncbi:RNA polymerase sigma factor [Nonomuraea typhae]|uniref:RNA polymerase sigma factor n=1 Tax=Nonomuraea typhae TaxID=2603600 RepID=UPI0012FB7A3D|nr:sigma-70 family RNA polymerase sigma factor [Nonomuraea typhae]
MSDPRATADVLAAAAGGDRPAWDVLVARFTPRMWSVVRTCGLDESDAADAVQGAWLRLLENLHRIKNPDGLGAWLATTARREALHILRKEPVPLPPPPMEEHDPAAAVLEADDHRLLWQAIATLHEPCRTLLTLSAHQVGNRQLAVHLGVPLGSIGPSKIRCLSKLRTLISPEETVQ